MDFDAHAAANGPSLVSLVPTQQTAMTGWGWTNLQVSLQSGMLALVDGCPHQNNLDPATRLVQRLACHSAVKLVLECRIVVDRLHYYSTVMLTETSVSIELPTLIRGRDTVDYLMQLHHGNPAISSSNVTTNGSRYNYNLSFDMLPPRWPIPFYLLC